MSPPKALFFIHKKAYPPLIRTATGDQKSTAVCSLEMKRTKIVATLGPSSSTPDVIAAMAEAGMNVARINVSHGTLAQHLSLIHI